MTDSKKSNKKLTIGIGAVSAIVIVAVLIMAVAKLSNMPHNLTLAKFNSIEYGYSLGQVKEIYRSFDNDCKAVSDGRKNIGEGAFTISYNYQSYECRVGGEMEKLVTFSFLEDMLEGKYQYGLD